MAQTARPKNALDKTLADTALDAQTIPAQQSVIREAPHVRTRTRRTFISYGGSKTHPEYQPFAEALRQAMGKAKLSASEVARRVWGTTKDKRGYTVARNRDRLGHYLAGTSYPEPSNLVLLAKAVDVPVEDLKIERREPNPGPRARSTGATLQMGKVPDQPYKLRIQIDLTLNYDIAQKIFDLAQKAEIAELEAVPTVPPDEAA